MVTILVVDDDPAVLLNTAAYLEDEDFQVFEASSGQQALNIMEQHCPEVGIIDMRLPKMDGNELILIAHKMCPQMQFIVHTGSTDYVLPESLVTIGLSNAHVVLKPVPDMQVFIDVISRLLENREASTE